MFSCKKKYWRKRKVGFFTAFILIAFVSVLLSDFDAGRVFANGTEYKSIPITGYEEGSELGSIDDVVTNYFRFFSLRPSVQFDECYRNQLDEDSKIVYDKAYEFFKNNHQVRRFFIKDIFNFTYENVSLSIDENTTEEDISAQISKVVMPQIKDIVIPALFALTYDHPEMSWITGASYGCGYGGETIFSQESQKATIVVNTINISFSGACYGTKDDMDAAVTKAKNIIDNNLGSNAQISDAKKIKEIHDYLINTIEYNHPAADEDPKDPASRYNEQTVMAYQTAYSAFYHCNGDELTMGTDNYHTVCAGYARGFKVLCDAYGIPCVFVSGDGGGPHAWNYVRLYGHWYPVDCTWDDQPTTIIYDYFLISGPQFNQQHTPSGIWSSGYSGEFIYPTLSDIKYCEHTTITEGVCGSCSKIVDPGLSVTMEGWTYGETAKAPVLATQKEIGLDLSDSDNYTAWYKKSGDPDTAYTEEVPMEAGNYTVRVEVELRDSSHDICPHRGSTAAATAEFTIEKAVKNLDFAGYSGTYDGAEHGAVILPVDMPEDADITYSIDGGTTWTLEMPTVKNVADTNKSVMVKLTGRKNYQDQTETISVNIAKKGLVVTPDSGQAKEYGEPDPELTYTVDGLVEGEAADVISGSLGRAAGTNKGSYEIHIGTLTADNYEITVTSGITFEIEKVTPVIAITKIEEKEYDGNSLSANDIEVNGIQEEAAVIYTYCKTAEGDYQEGLPIDAGAWYVIAKTAETINYKPGKSAPFKATISPATLTISGAEIAEKIYDGDRVADVLSVMFVNSKQEDVELADSEYIAEGLFDDPNSGEAKRFEVTATLMESVKNYVLDGSSYIGYGKIKKAEPNFVFNGYRGTYDGASHDAVILPADLPEDAVVTYLEGGSDTWSLTKPQVKNVSDSGKTVGVKVAESANYLEQTRNVEVKWILKKELFVTPDSGQAKEKGQDDPELTYTVDGLAGEDTEAVVTGMLGRQAGETLGDYEIEIGSLAADNYDITFTPGVMFAIQKITPQLLIAEGQGKTYDKTPLSDLTVAGVMEDANVTYTYCKTAAGTYINGLPTDGGTWYVVASTKETDNYKAAKSAPMTVVISPAPIKIIGARISRKVYDGTATANVGSITFADAEDSPVVLASDSYTAAGVFENASSGEGKSVTVTVTLLDTVTNYSLPEPAFETTANINKAMCPPVVPDLNMEVPYTCEKIGDIPLPEGWEWFAPYVEEPVEVGTTKATAVYHGDDKGNYVTEGYEITIVKLPSEEEPSVTPPEKDPSSEEEKPSTPSEGEKPATPSGGETPSEEEKPSKPSGETPSGSIEEEKPSSGDTQTPSTGGNTPSGEDKPDAPSGTEQDVTLPVINEKKTDPKSKASVKVTNSGTIVNGVVSEAEVAYIKPAKSASKITVPATVKIDNVTYKVTSIEAGAFKNDKKLTSITIPEHVKTIGANAFANCKKLKKITIKSTKLKSIGKNAFKNINKKAVIKVPKSKYAEYKKKMTSKTGFKKTMKLKK